MHRSKKAITPLTIIMWYAIAAVFYIFICAPIMNHVAQDAIVSGQATGIEAFMFANLNIFIFVFSLIACFGMMYFVGGGG